MKKSVDGVLVDLTDDEVAAYNAIQKAHEDGQSSAAFSTLRFKRNELLTNSDWRVMPDSPLADDKKTEWIDYRKKLRDLPASYNNSTVVGTITWPTEPS